ncbi:KH domain-containing protein, putative [Eimeria praecox]|uniref:KH domain-containing protein, putative n=1 Tax=Eimeria praecox TaxID=51316 RepID=U6GAE0_9EIME|nr:KH domain-containing protein, putative [Eimeria praecox]
MVFVPSVALWLSVFPLQHSNSRSLFRVARLCCTQAMPPPGSRYQRRIPVCLERPQYDRHCIGGANYRVLKIPAAAASLNRKEWDEEAFEELAGGKRVVGLSDTVSSQTLQQDRKGVDDELSLHSFSSSDSEEVMSQDKGLSDTVSSQTLQQDRKGVDDELSLHSFSSSDSEEVMSQDSSCTTEMAAAAAAAASMTLEEIKQQEEELDDEFVASCAATQDGARFKVEYQIPFSIYKRLTRRKPSLNPLNKTFDVLGVSAEWKRATTAAPTTPTAEMALDLK